METEQLIEKFLEKTNYLNDEGIMLMMAYGSRITDNADENSDLDILIVTSSTVSRKSALTIEGIPIDITIYSMEDAEREIKSSKITGSTYMESVLKTGRKIINRYDTYDNLYNSLNYQINKKRILNPELLELAVDHVEYFMNDTYDKDVHYFLALESLRRLYHAKNNCSNINMPKVHKLYTNRELAEKQYMVKLPNDEFIGEYLDALEEKDLAKRKAYLVKFLKEFQDEKVGESNSTEFLTDQVILGRLITLNKIVLKCKEMLLENDPYANALYYMAIGQLVSFYPKIYREESSQLNQYYNEALQANNPEERIRYLENIFSMLDSKYQFDYNEFTIRM